MHWPRACVERGVSNKTYDRASMMHTPAPGQHFGVGECAMHRPGVCGEQVVRNKTDKLQ
jgi:hypothetical protein